MSDDSQDRSPQRQDDFVREWCRLNGVVLIEPPDRPFLDEGITGTTNDRKELKRLIRIGRSLGANAVIMDQLSRISRTDAIEAIEEVYGPLRRSGLRYAIDASRSAIHDLYDANCILFVTLEQGHDSHAESKSIAHRVATGMKSLRTEGYYFGKKAPPGYKIVDRRKNKFGQVGCGKLAIVPEEAEVILRIFEMYLKLRSTIKVACEMGLPVCRVIQTLDQPVY